MPAGAGFRLSVKRGDPHALQVNEEISVSRGPFHAMEVDVPIVTVKRPAFGGLPDAAIVIAADNTARRLAAASLEAIRPITPVDTGELQSSLSLIQLGPASWAVVYGPFYGYFQFWGTRYIQGLRTELNDILRAVVATAPAVLAEEVAAVGAAA